MRRIGIYVLIILVVIALLGSMSVGCKGGTSSTTTTTKTQLSTGSTQLTTSSTQSGNITGLPKGLPDITDMKSLPSYRFSIMTKMVEGSGAPAGSVDYMKYEWVRDQKAEHAWREDANGKVTETYIRIGDKYWIWFGMAGMGWVEQPVQTTPTTSELPSDLISQLKQVQQDMGSSTAHFNKKGTETVNNVRCIRYEFEYSLTTDMPNLVTGGTRKIDTHSSGEMWIADQSGLPTVVIKSKSTAEMTMEGEKTVMDSEQNLTDIGANITINPPEGAMTPPTGLPTSSTTTTTTTASATPTFSDDFQGAWNSKFVWTDPNKDVTYSFTAHTGFLRLTVPDGNDLAGITNYDAPRLMVPQKDNFTLETLMEFDPKDTYQGAGLLVWQDEDAFLRLEFGFGGMGGGAKNVVFVSGKDGGLDLIGSIDLPDTLKRIELRLQRSSNQYTAWYRQVGGTWQKIGSTDFSLNSTVNVGITQVTEYTESQIFADFDYFKIFTP